MVVDLQSYSEVGFGLEVQHGWEFSLSIRKTVVFSARHFYPAENLYNLKTLEVKNPSMI